MFSKTSSWISQHKGPLKQYLAWQNLTLKSKKHFLHTRSSNIYLDSHQFNKRQDIKVFNSLSGNVEVLKPRKEGTISWYSCGPTVYDHSHIGHARNYISLDIITRILEDYFNYNVVHVLGMTDVDDKIIKRSLEKRISPRDLAKHFESDFFEDMKHLGVKSPTSCSRVTEHIPEIIEYVEKIVENGYGYKIADGSVYFDTEKLGKAYGKLSTLGDIQDEDASSLKKNHRDFVLWKSTTNGDTQAHPDLSWETTWSKEGRPGWHIECSAMSSKYLGGKIDVHWGGIDLKFPHHNNEIAQADAYHGYHTHGENWVNYWLHSGHLHIQGLKMSKSLKNFITIKDYFEQYGSSDEFRMFCLNVGYRSDVDFSVDRIIDARNQIARFQEFLNTTDRLLAEKRSPKLWSNDEHKLYETLQNCKDEIDFHFTNNFDNPKVIKSLLDLIKNANQYISRSDEFNCSLLLENVVIFVRKILTILGLSFVNTTQSSQAVRDSEQSDIIKILLDFRNNVRNMSRSDEFSADSLLKATDALRNDILPDAGILVKDLPDGTYDFKMMSIQERQLLIEEKKRKEELQEIKRRKEEEERLLSAIPPSEFLRDDEYYTKYDEDGIPTHDIHGEILSKSTRKKLVKKYEKHKARYNKYANVD